MLKAALVGVESAVLAAQRSTRPGGGGDQDEGGSFGFPNMTWCRDAVVHGAALGMASLGRLVLMSEVWSKVCLTLAT